MEASVRHRAAVLLCTLTLLASAPFARSQGALRIDWEVIDRFRLLERAEDHAFLVNRIASLIKEEAATSGGYTVIAQPMKGHMQRREEDLRPVKTAWQEGEARYRPGWAFADQWQLRLNLQPAPGAGSRCVWRIDGAEAQRTCAPLVRTLKRGQRVAVDIESGQARLRTAEWTVEIKDRLILVLGDSYGSGEGYPDVVRRIVPKPADGGPDSSSERIDVPGRWWDQRCHRSMFSGAAMAAVRFSWVRKQESTTFMSYACSGAAVGKPGEAIRGGLLTGYEGREDLAYRQRISNLHSGFLRPRHDEPDLEAQVGTAVRDLCRGATSVADGRPKCEGDLRVPDLVVVSVGGNDIGFGGAIEKLLLGRCDAECAETLGAGRKEILNERYDSLARSVQASLQGPRVMLMEYPNPLRHDSGDFCDDRRYPRSALPPAIRDTFGRLGIAVISYDEYRLAYRNLYRPLHEEGDRAVERHAALGWMRGPNVSVASNNKGVCAMKRWINDVAVAYRRGGEVNGLPAGTFHPNFYGYYNYAFALQEALHAALPVEQAK